MKRPKQAESAGLIGQNHASLDIEGKNDMRPIIAHSSSAHCDSYIEVNVDFIVSSQEFFKHSLMSFT